MTGTISGRTVVVVGGSRGIGLEWVARLLEQSNTVVATARDTSAIGLKKLAAGEHGSRLILTQLEVASADSITAWAESLKGTVPHVDVLIYNAGVLRETMQTKLPDVTAQMLTDTFATNTIGPLLVTQALAKQGLLGGDSPSLGVYMTSIVASVGSLPYAGFSPLYAYRASKAALNTLVRTMGAELAPSKVSTVVIHPGYVATDMTSGGSISPGAISTSDSISDMLKILQDGREVHDKFFSHTGEELPW